MAWFVDSNVFIYAVGRSHPLQEEARAWLDDALANRLPLATSAEVLQELLHAYIPVGRLQTLDAALRIATDLATIWPVDASDVIAARLLASSMPGLSARDLLHLVVCRRYEVTRILSFDRSLVAAFGSQG